jgi:hypothetical protein
MTQVSANKPERARLREPREEREPGMGGVMPWEQGRLFAQLFADDGDGAGYATSHPGPTTPTDTSTIQALAEQLAPRVQGGSQWPLHAVLYLPRLGRINACVGPEAGAWNIELEAEEERTTRWLIGVRQRCQDGLAEALGQPVSLHLAAVASA